MNRKVIGITVSIGFALVFLLMTTSGAFSAGVVAVEPTKGYYGTVFQITCSGFVPGEEVNELFRLPDGTKSGPFNLGPADENGDVHCWNWFAVPGEPIGVYRVVVKGQMSGPAWATFKVLRATNLVANGSFEKDGSIPAPWKGKKLTPKDRRVCNTAYLGSCSFRMVGTKASKSLLQVVRISGSAGDSFTLLGISKARRPLRKGGTYCLEAKVFHTDGTKKRYKACFDKRTHDWEMTFKTFTVAKNYNKFMVYLCYAKQTGKVWFDDVWLIAR